MCSERPRLERNSMKPPRTSTSSARSGSSEADEPWRPRLIHMRGWAPHGSPASADLPQAHMAALRANISVAWEPAEMSSIRWLSPSDAQFDDQGGGMIAEHRKGEGHRRRHHLRRHAEEHCHERPQVVRRHRQQPVQTREPQEVVQHEGHHQLAGSRLLESIGSMGRRRQRALGARRQGHEAVDLERRELQRRRYQHPHGAQRAHSAGPGGR